jgi:methylated-DNA-[protein]-cysteine S-methyltransferase
MDRASDELDAYFHGERQRFQLDLDLWGRPFELEVWRLLLAIPYGATTTYGALAKQIDESLYPAGLEPYKRARMTGAAIGRNPTPILVPCHRVIAANGSLTGYLGGLHRKQALLDLEQAHSSRADPTGRPSSQLALL